LLFLRTKKKSPSNARRRVLPPAHSFLLLFIVYFLFVSIFGYLATAASSGGVLICHCSSLLHLKIQHPIATRRQQPTIPPNIPPNRGSSESPALIFDDKESSIFSVWVFDNFFLRVFFFGVAMVSGVSETTRTILYSVCIVGLWFPLAWLIGAILVMKSLTVAPTSQLKSGMHLSFGLVLLLLVVFCVAAVVSATTVEKWEMVGPFSLMSAEWMLNLKLISGFLLSLYALCGLLFVMFADATFRSVLGPVVNDLRSPLCLRGVHLGLNISGMCLPMPLFSLIGIPITLHQINVMRRAGRVAGWFTTTMVAGILSFLSIVAYCLFIIIAGSLKSPYQRLDFEATAREKARMGCFNRTEATGMFTTTSSSNDMHTLSHDPLPIFVDNCPDLNVQKQVPLLEDFVPVTALVVIVVVFNIVFIALADRIILQEIAPPRKVVRKCASCNTDIQFIARGGKPTFVKCYKCGTLAHFSD
jgi:hypothetical protein